VRGIWWFCHALLVGLHCIVVLLCITYDTSEKALDDDRSMNRCDVDDMQHVLAPFALSIGNAPLPTATSERGITY
jgi:hypothetical protein